MFLSALKVRGEFRTKVKKERIACLDSIDDSHLEKGQPTETQLGLIQITSPRIGKTNNHQIMIERKNTYDNSLELLGHVQRH